MSDPTSHQYLRTILSDIDKRLDASESHEFDSPLSKDAQQIVDEVDFEHPFPNIAQLNQTSHDH